MQGTDGILKNLEGKGRLIYLCKYGSHLYGLNTPESDIDYRGIFVPNLKDVLRGNFPKEVSYTTGDSNSKNTNQDVDAKLFSVQKFLDLCYKGDTNGLDLLFSVNNPDAIIMQDFSAKMLMSNPLALVNLETADAYVGYAISQARKYGIKGSRLGALKKVMEYLDSIKKFNNDRLSDIAIDLMDHCHHESYCFVKEQNGLKYIVLCGAMHQLNITLEEFIKRVEKTYSEYGARSEAAQSNEGVDWKAVSHAVRVLFQCEQLYKEGTISFPVRGKDTVMAIKQGKLPYSGVEHLIIEMLERVDKAKYTTAYNKTYDQNFVDQMLSYIYGVK